MGAECGDWKPVEVHKSIVTRETGGIREKYNGVIKMLDAVELGDVIK